MPTFHNPDIARPTVSIIIPCYNEQETIHLLLDAIHHQTYPQQEMEVIIADGMSTDQTREVIARFQQNQPGLPVKILDNPKRNIPSALNKALEAAQGEFIVRLDAHAAPAFDYVARCVEALNLECGDNVGGVWNIVPGIENARSGRGHRSHPGWLPRSIAAAGAHPFGVGDAHYRHATQPQFVDTVPFGAFRRSLVEKIGPFDESLLTNEDYEFNVRIQKSGGKIWLDPAIRSTYYARTRLSSLVKQYWRYGFWKGQMLRRYPETIRWRQGIPPLFVLSLASLAILTFLSDFAGLLLSLEISLYLLVLISTSLVSAIHKRDPALILGIPLAIITMHLCWGTALIWSFLFQPQKG